MNKFKIGERVKIIGTSEQLGCACINVNAKGQCGVVTNLKKLDALQKELASFRFEVSEFGVYTDDPRDGLNAIIAQEVIKQ